MPCTLIVLLDVSCGKGAVMQNHYLGYLIILWCSFRWVNLLYLSSQPLLWNEAFGPKLQLMELLQVLSLDVFFGNNDEMEWLMEGHIYYVHHLFLLIGGLCYDLLHLFWTVLNEYIGSSSEFMTTDSTCCQNEEGYDIYIC